MPDPRLHRCPPPGQVDWVENVRRRTRFRRSRAPSFAICQSEQPHVWPWQFSRIEGSPWQRPPRAQGGEPCVDRNAMKDGLLPGLMVSATGTFEPGHPWRGNPKFQIKHDPNPPPPPTAAGFSKDKRY